MDVFSILISTAACTMPAGACDAQFRTGIDAKLLQAVCLVESSGNSKAYVHKDGGSPSYGICQIKLETAVYLGFTGTSQDLMYAPTNYYWAARYLKRHLNRYQTVQEAISAYNAGRPVGTNTKYVTRVLGQYRKLSGVQHGN